MISVGEAISRITGAFEPLAAETVWLGEAVGRVLAEDVVARTTQPPFDVSAMDGYAVRSEDVTHAPVTIRQIGDVPAGQQFEGTVGPGETVRIFTGSRMPNGADTIVIQENTEADGQQITVLKAARKAQFIRPAGLDFSAGDIGLKAGQHLTPRAIGYAAAMNHPSLAVRRKPRVAILATGDEIVMPGEPIGPNQIVSSNSHALAAAVRNYGGEPLSLGIAPDDRQGLKAMAAGARGADILVTTGGASVGDHDLVQSVLGEIGLELDFWKIAMRPGKPLIFGSIGDTRVLGLPGNPVSALVCALIFLRPAMFRMLGLAAQASPEWPVRIDRDLAANDERQDYLRATLQTTPDGELSVSPFDRQDSSMISLLAQSEALIVRPPFDPAVVAGDVVKVIPFSSDIPLI
ncbi:MAG: molybdopterin molybdotransferase MoeA [Proteobacteria bacterium]|nr:molybdopterin molybdotransferase MoeA [Pseudomonadota bacterium]MDA1355793.1 molybdopterin molybdotransferase MoeA [Pseudomonadota bacterium]